MFSSTDSLIMWLNLINQMYAAIQNHILEKDIFITSKNINFWKYFWKIVDLEANKLEPRSGPTYVGPDLGSSLFAILQKYWWISIPNKMA